MAASSNSGIHHRAAGEPFEQAHVVRAIGALELRSVVGKLWIRACAQPRPLAGDGQVGICRRDMQQGGHLDIERVGILTQVRDLEHPVAVRTLDHERLIALAAEVTRRALDPEQLTRDRRHLLGRKRRRRGFQNSEIGLRGVGHQREPIVGRL